SEPDWHRHAFHFQVLSSRAHPEAIIPIQFGIAIPPIACRQDYIHHLPGRDEVSTVSGAASAFLDQLAEKPLHRYSEQRPVIRGDHAMAVKLDEQPVGPMLDSDRSVAPEHYALHGRRIFGSELTILDVRKSACREATEVHAERTLENKRE